MQKSCTKCHQTLPVKSFYKDASKSSGYESQCKNCRKGRSVYAEVTDVVRSLVGKEKEYEEHRLQRSVALATAREHIWIEQTKQVAKEYFSGKIVPTGYALKPKPKIKRSVCLLLSDLHIGAELSSLDNPLPFGAVQEARCLEKVMRETLDFKPQYRSQSELVLLLNGDLIDGHLQHDQRDGSPLVEQKAAFWHYLGTMLGFFAQQFPSVRVYCQPGNHGRDKLRHPGRATSSKWDGHEWEMYYALSKMCSELRNVSFEIPFRALSFVPLHGSTLLLTHGDTEIKLGDPDNRAKENATSLDRLRATGMKFDVAVFGHFHKPRWIPRNPDMLFNGALLPPNGYARTEGYLGEARGQWLWEAVEGFPVGDLRFIRVESADSDSSLGQLVTPFRFAA